MNLMPQTSVFELIAQAGWFVKLILILLAGCSVYSWGIIVQKLLALSVASRQSARFREALASDVGLPELFDIARTLHASPLANFFCRAYEAHAQGRRGALASTLKGFATAEVERMQSYLAVLATTGSTTPFIGLLGTVWGIMDAFRGIGAAGSASLAVVSPAIAEALITTAAGLLAAIPAVMAYNAFVNWVRKAALELDDLADALQEQLKEHPTPHDEDRLAARLSR